MCAASRDCIPQVSQRHHRVPCVHGGVGRGRDGQCPATTHIRLLLGVSQELGHSHSVPHTADVSRRGGPGPPTPTLCELPLNAIFGAPNEVMLLVLMMFLRGGVGCNFSVPAFATQVLLCVRHWPVHYTAVGGRQ